MKNFKLIAFFCLFAGLAKSQPYGELTYPHTGGSTMSSGIATNVNFDGFVMAGYRPTSLATTDNFFIDQADKNGGFTMSGAFSNGYKIRKAALNNCSTALTAVTNCHGVTVIETPAISAPNGEAYALAGTFANGIFFSCLKSDGTPISPGYYNFNNSPTAASISKPLLALAPSFGSPSYMNYYICGSYASAGVQYMYVLVVDQTGAIQAQTEFNFAATGILEPKAIIASTALLGNLVIVGNAYDPSSMVTGATRGFFMDMTPGNITPSVFNLFGQTLSTISLEAFTSITKEDGTSLDYIIGGSSDLSGPTATDWFVKMLSGGTSPWSKIFSPFNADDVGGVVGIVNCRVTPTIGSPYLVTFGVSQSPTEGIVTMKVDNTGLAFGTGDNTFYNTVLNQISRPLNITAKLNSPFDSGIHIFGNDNMTTSSTHYLALSYLNGVGQCVPSTNNLGSTSNGPSINTANSNLSGIIPTSYQKCASFDLIKSSITPNLNTICLASSVLGGSNNRVNTATGISESTLSNHNLGLAPNPTTGKTTISYNIQGNGKVHFTLYNNLGQLVKDIYAGQDTDGEHSVELDLNGLGIEAGIYFLNAELNEARATQKIIYTKN